MKAKKQQCYQISGFVGFDLSVLGLDWWVEERVREEIEWAGENNSGIVPGLQASNLKNKRPVYIEHEGSDSGNDFCQFSLLVKTKTKMRQFPLISKRNDKEEREDVLFLLKSFSWYLLKQEAFQVAWSGLIKKLRLHAPSMLL